jgi:GTP-binding protein
VALNKVDVTENRDRAEIVAERLGGARIISGATHEGLPELLETLHAAVEFARLHEEETVVEPEPEREYTYTPPFEAVAIPGGFRIEGKRVLRAVNMTDFDNPQAVRHLHLTLGHMGLFRTLKRLGATPGQTILIGETELEYQPD